MKRVSILATLILTFTLFAVSCKEQDRKEGVTDAPGSFNDNHPTKEQSAGNPQDTATANSTQTDPSAF